MSWRAVLLAALLIGAAPAAAQWPPVPLPEGSRGEVVSDHMINNGVHMRASRFHVMQSVEEVLAFYRSRWEGRSTEAQHEGKTIVSTVLDGHFITVQLAPSGPYTEGTIGVSRPPGKDDSHTPGAGFDMPSDTEVLGDVTFLDTPTRARTLSLFNAYTPFVNHQFYQTRLPARGWRPDGASTCRADSRDCLAQYTHPRGGRITISFQRLGHAGSQIVVLQE